MTIPQLTDEDVAALMPDHRSIVAKLARDIDSVRELPFVAKTTIGAQGGTYFQSLPSILPNDRRAFLKWVSISPTSTPSVKATILLSDAEDGRTLAIIDGGRITAMRTAAMSYLAFIAWGEQQPGSMSFIGTGAQAQAHLSLFTDLCPSIVEVHVFSEPNAALDKFRDRAAQLGLRFTSHDDPRSAVAAGQVIVSSVPGSTLAKPFLQTEWVRGNAFVSMVDLGRSWELGKGDPTEYRTDDRRQSKILADGGYFPKDTLFIGDLFSRDEDETRRSGPNFFLFGGLPVADASLASAIYDRYLGRPSQ